jgi:hypothetical protein
LGGIESMIFLPLPMSTIFFGASDFGGIESIVFVPHLMGTVFFVLIRTGWS